MNFQSWLQANKQQVMQHLRSGGSLTDLIQYDAQSGGFRDPFSGQQVQANPAELQTFMSGLGANGSKANYLNGFGAEGYSEGGPPTPSPGAGFKPPEAGGDAGQGGFSEWSFMEDPALRQSFLSLMDQLGSQAGNDTEIQRTMLDWYNQQHRDMLGRQGYLDQVAGDVLGYQKHGDKWTPTGASFDPDNANAFSGIAPEVQGISKDLESQLRQLEESGLDPASLARAKQQLTNQAYSAKAGARQNQVSSMRDYMLGQLSEARNTQAAPLTGAAGTGAGLLNQRYGIDSGNSLSAWNTGQQVGQSNLDRALREKLGLSDLDLRGRQLTQDDQHFNKNLEFQRWATQQQQKKSGGFGGFLGGLLGLGSSLIPGGGLLSGIFGGKKQGSSGFNPGSSFTGSFGNNNAQGTSFSLE